MNPPFFRGKIPDDRLYDPEHHVWVLPDDDDEVHAVTRLILAKMRYKERGVELLTARSAAEARQVLMHESDIAAILLDVVMETDDAGLQLVRTIRNDLGNRSVRIILRTGQPGQAPEDRVIVDYDINDYKAKSELTAQKLFATVVAALRAYETIVSLEKTRVGLERILDSTGTLFQVHSLQQFASGVLTQLSAFLGCQPNGVLCLQPEPGLHLDGSPAHDDLRILASSGAFDNYMSKYAGRATGHDGEVFALARQAIREERNLLTENYTVLYLDAGGTQSTVTLLHGGLGVTDESDQKLLEVFAAKIAIALANALNYQKMISAEVAATTDFLTGLNNRRQLLRLGIPLLAGACRGGAPLAVAMLDIDHFKKINDTWGHDAGDEVLKALAAQLKVRFRTSDVIARFGGEEFCIVAPNLDAAAAFVLFDGFRQSLQAMSVTVGTAQLSVTVSIGISTLVNESIDTMISAADALLYKAKQGGRNRVVVA